jgi:hypothetical protein
MRNTALSVARNARIEMMDEFIVWPDTPKCKARKQNERQPLAITSEKRK